jgi:hypothetical protein
LLAQLRGRTDPLGPALGLLQAPLLSRLMLLLRVLQALPSPLQLLALEGPLRSSGRLCRQNGSRNYQSDAAWLAHSLRVLSLLRGP